MSGMRVERQHEIGKRADQRGLHLQRRIAVERAVIGGEQVLGERQPRGDTSHLLPEAAPHRVLVAREIHLVARNESNASWRHAIEFPPEASEEWRAIAAGFYAASG